MIKQSTITILIPAYNEEENITSCINSILNQKGDSYLVKKILVISDGSTDATVERVQLIDSPIITCVTWKENQGIEAAVDYAFRNTSNDFIIKLDGDLAFNNNHALERILKKQKENQSDLVYIGQNYQTPDQTLLQKYIAYIHGQLYKKDLLPQLTEPQYLQTHIVGSYLIPRDLYKKITIPSDIVPEDVYIFYKAQEEGFVTSYLLDPQVYFAYPQSWSHHLSQITRWGTPLLGNHFTRSFLAKYDARLPLSKIVPILLKAFWCHPLFVSILVGTRILVLIKRPFYIRRQLLRGKRKIS